MKSFHGDHLGAIADFTAMILLWPTSPDGFTGRAAARERAGDLRGAIEDYSAAIAIDPQRRPAREFPGPHKNGICRCIRHAAWDNDRNLPL